MSRGSSTTVVRETRSSSEGSASRSAVNWAAETSPSNSATAVQYGRLWSAVSRVFGRHFSGSWPMISTATRNVAISIERMREGSPILPRMSNAAAMADWL